MGNPKIVKGAEDLANVADKFVQTKDERQKIATERLKIDAQSDSGWAKSIRPFAFGFLLVMLGYMIIVNGHWGIQFDEKLVGTHNQALFAMIGFYTVSRGIEKVSNVMNRKGWFKKKR